MGFPDKNTGVGCHFSLQGIFLTTSKSALFQMSPLCENHESLEVINLKSPELILSWTTNDTDISILVFKIKCLAYLVSSQGPTVLYLLAPTCELRASQVMLVVKNPPANVEAQEMWVQSLGWEDPLEEGMATHSSILAWRILWTEEPGGLLHRVAKSQIELKQLSIQHTHTYVNYGNV